MTSDNKLSCTCKTEKCNVSFEDKYFETDVIIEKCTLCEAAPDLLKACKEALFCRLTPQTRDKIKKALLKAKGESV